MTRELALAVLRRERETLRERFGVGTVALFGSVARDQAGPSSDVDVLVEFERPVSLFDLAGIQQYLQKALGVARVDVVPRDCIYPELETSIVAGAIDVR